LSIDNINPHRFWKHWKEHILSFNFNEIPNSSIFTFTLGQFWLKILMYLSISIFLTRRGPLKTSHLRIIYRLKKALFIS
jgi:hypothetical protein